jgi:hypothetical protein
MWKNLGVSKNRILVETILLHMPNVSPSLCNTRGHQRWSPETWETRWLSPTRKEQRAALSSVYFNSKIFLIVLQARVSPYKAYNRWLDGPTSHTLLHRHLNGKGADDAFFCGWRLLQVCLQSWAVTPPPAEDSAWPQGGPHRYRVLSTL